MAVGKNFLDNYSVFCVFGSVVGCVVVPLITQSVESLIFSAILISLTANRFSKKVVIEPAIKGEGKETKGLKGSKEKDVNLAVCKKKKKPPSNTNNNVNTQSAMYHQLSPSELRRQHKEEVERREYERLREQERKEEEKRERKLKKKEERQKRKNSEKKNCEFQTFQHYFKQINLILMMSMFDETVVKMDKKATGYTTHTEKAPRGVPSPKAEERSRSTTFTEKTSSLPHHTTFTTSPQSSTSSSYMNTRSSNSQKKYDYQRPNIPRFARQAAKNRQQFGYTTSPVVNIGSNTNTAPSPTTTTPVSPAVPIVQPQPVPWCRSTPSPPISENSVPIATVAPTMVVPPSPVIQPRVHSVIGCREVDQPISVTLMDAKISTSPRGEEGAGRSGCYSLFGDHNERGRSSRVRERVERGREQTFLEFKRERLFGRRIECTPHSYLDFLRKVSFSVGSIVFSMSKLVGNNRDLSNFNKR
eukprot:sb/3464361/